MLRFDKEKFKTQVVAFLEIDPEYKEKLLGICPGHKEKRQLVYLANYLDDIGASTVILEHSYTDRILQADYPAYWTDDSKTSQYSRGRFHFFADKFGESSWDEKNGELNKLDSDNFYKLHRQIKENSKSYLGYMVVIRGSTRFIASTCLPASEKLLSRYEEYEEDAQDKINKQGKQKVINLATRSYKASLLGVNLKVGNSLGFMEQDTAVSACATCAAWSAIQKTSQQYEHESLTPGQITALALGKSRALTILPGNKGLQPKHLQRLFEYIPQLNVFVLSAYHEENKTKDFKKTNTDEAEFRVILDKILPVLNQGTPVILGIEKQKGKEKHAICLTGYTYGSASRYEDNPIVKNLSDRITGLIAHDDNIGAFVKYNVLNDKTIRISESSKCDNGKPNDIWSVKAAICPTSSSVRMYPHNEIQKYISEIFEKRSKEGFIYEDDLLWSCRLWASNEYKQNIMQIIEKEHPAALEPEKYPEHTKILIELLEMNLPEYIYVASATGTYRFDFVFSIAGPWNNACIDIVPLDEISCNLLERGSEKEDEAEQLES